MAEEKNGTTPDEETPDEAGGGGKLKLILIAVIGLLVGGTAGFSKGGNVLGPMLAARAEGAGPNGAGADGEHGEGGDASAIHIVENLVVNPARSGGTRFLLTSVAVEAMSPDLIEYVQARDVEIRAALILVLGAKTTEELSDIDNRPAIVREIRSAITDILGRERVRNVLIPQFVIQ